jgi:hypothetical protein
LSFPRPDKGNPAITNKKITNLGQVTFIRRSPGAL